MNVRRMQRHLAVWGVTFHDLLDEYRSRMALSYMQSRKYSVTDVAFRLGYSDTAHFIRAFRRWNGISPRHLHSIRVVGEPHPSQGDQPVEVVRQQNLLAAVAR
jgi:AraC-like DNA-binding protein